MAITFHAGYDNSPHKIANPIERGTVYSGSAMSFDGTNDYINLGNSLTLKPNGTISISVWFKRDALGTRHIITTTGNHDSSEEGAWLSLEANNKIQVMIGNTSGQNGYETTNTLDDIGVWHHIVLTHTGTTSIIYLDGKLFQSGTTRALLHNTGSPTDVYIGNGVNMTDEFAGDLSDFRIWNVALTLAQIQEMYKQPELSLPTGTSSSNVVGKYLLNEGAGTTLTDLSGNGNHGTINGATWDNSDNNMIYQRSLVKHNAPMSFDGTNASESERNYVNVSTGRILEDPDDWSVSAWVYPYSANTGQAKFGGIALFDFGTGAAQCGIITSQDLFRTFYNNAGKQTSSTFSANQWYHLVATSDGNSTFNLYMNGVAQSGGASDSGWNTADNTIGRGWTGDGGHYFHGIINEVALYDKTLSGTEVTSLYNSGVPVSATDVADANLKGYWRNDGVGQWTDRSNKSSAIYFDGSDHLSFAHNSGIEFGTNPFTLEMNIRFDSGYGSQQGIMSVHGNTGADRMFNWERYGNKFSFYGYDSNGDESYINDSWNPVAEQWYHIAMVRNGADVKFYIDGTQFGSTHDIGVSTSIADGGYPLLIGGSTNTSDSIYSRHQGHMSGIRISKGIARYTGNFTKPSGPFTSDANTSFLLNGGGLADESSNSVAVTNSGDTSIVGGLGLVIANNGTVYGTPSSIFIPEGSTTDKDALGFPLTDTLSDVLSLDDPGYLEIPQNADFTFGAKDFTVEFWINIKELETGVLIGNAWDVNTRKGWSLYWNKSDTSLYLKWSNTTSSSWNGDAGKSWTPDLNTWIHFHLVRSGDTFTFYENNSVITSSFTDSDPFPTELTKPFRIGADPDDTAANFFNASFDEVRIYHKALSSDERIQNYNHGAVAHGKTVI